MPMRILELNDSGVRLISRSAEVFSSPGFAQDDGSSLILGAEAEQLCKLNPTSSYDKFWYQLSLEPLANSTVRIRHNADIAYAHLQQLAAYVGEELEEEPDTVIAVPANFNRDQLAVLLGLLKATPFEAAALIDTALLSSIQNVQGRNRVVHADIQLHQVVLSSLQREDDELRLESVVQIPGVGLQNFYDQIMQLAKELFVQQCRFNPQHNAESEQQLYNAIPQWLSQEMEDSTLTLELSTGDSVHIAKLPRSAMLNHLQAFYRKIVEQIQHLAPESPVTILISQKLADLPEFLSCLSSIELADQDRFSYKVLSEYAIANSMVELSTYFKEQKHTGRLLSSLPFGNLEKTATGPEDTITAQCPTHALFANRALALGSIVLGNGSHDSSNPNGSIISFNENSEKTTLGTIQREGDQVYLLSDGKLTLNQRTIAGRQRLAIGDRIGTREVSEYVQMIEVANSV